MTYQEKNKNISVKQKYTQWLSDDILYSNDKTLTS